jgi:hypothetical protein
VSHPTPRLLAATRGGSGIRLVARLARLVCRDLSPTTTESDSSDIRGGWGGWPDSCPRLVRLCRALSGSVGRRCHGRRNSSDSPSSRSKVPPTPRLVDSSDSLSDEDVTGGTTRQTRRRSKVPPTPRLVDSSTRRLLDSSTPRFFWIFGSPGDRIRAAYPLGKFDESDAAPFKCVSGRRLSDDPVARMPPPPTPSPPSPTQRNAPGVQINRLSRWHKVSYAERYRSDTS